MARMEKFNSLIDSPVLWACKPYIFYALLKPCLAGFQSNPLISLNPKSFLFVFVFNLIFSCSLLASCPCFIPPIMLLLCLLTRGGKWCGASLGFLRWIESLQGKIRFAKFWLAISSLMLYLLRNFDYLNRVLLYQFLLSYVQLGAIYK